MAWIFQGRYIPDLHDLDHVCRMGSVLRSSCAYFAGWDLHDTPLAQYQTYHNGKY